MNYLKILSIAIVVMLIANAIMASTSFADQLNADTSGSTTLTGRQGTIAVFKTTAGQSECENALYGGVATIPATSAVVTPTYSNCLCLGVECVIDMNSCSYKLNLEGGTSTTIKADIQCSEPGDEITLTSSKCTIHVPPQTGLAKIEGVNLGTAMTREIKLTLELGGIQYKHTKGNGTGKCTTGEGSTGTLTGDVTVTASRNGTHVGIFLA
jgi:hypothetical protein